MTDTHPEDGRLVAVTNVSVDGTTHVPGDVFEVDAEDAAELIAMGAARAYEDGDEDGDLELVKGIGPKTAAQLKALGLESVEELAGVDDDALPRLATALDKDADTVTDWRDQARKLRAP